MDELRIGMIVQYSYFPSENKLITLPAIITEVVNETTVHLFVAGVNHTFHVQGGSEYVQLKALEIQLSAINKWDGKLPQQFIPDSTLPFINLDK
jgi:hypothetical protein